MVPFGNAADHWSNLMKFDTKSIPLNMSNAQFPSQISIQMLDFTITKHLSWLKHILNMARTAAKRLILHFRARRFFRTKQLLKLTMEYLLSHLECCCCSYCCCTQPSESTSRNGPCKWKSQQSLKHDTTSKPPFSSLCLIDSDLCSLDLLSLPRHSQPTHLSSPKSNPCCTQFPRLCANY